MDTSNHDFQLKSTLGFVSAFDHLQRLCPGIRGRELVHKMHIYKQDSEVFPQQRHLGQTEKYGRLF